MGVSVALADLLQPRTTAARYGTAGGVGDAEDVSGI